MLLHGSGVTHPHIPAEGDKYRLYLQNLAKDSGPWTRDLSQPVRLSPRELVELIGGARYYITPYRHKGQVVSGNACLALSAGKAIILDSVTCTRLSYWTINAGVLVPFDDPRAIAEKTIELLDNCTARHAMRKRAYSNFEETMVWIVWLNNTWGAFERRVQRALRNPRATFFGAKHGKGSRPVSAVKLDHLQRMTDHTGIVEHAVFTVPTIRKGLFDGRHARALIVTILLEESGRRIPAGSSDLAARYLAFLWLAFDPITKRFRNASAMNAVAGTGRRSSHGRDPVKRTQQMRAGIGSSSKRPAVPRARLSCKKFLIAGACQLSVLPVPATGVHS